MSPKRNLHFPRLVPFRYLIYAIINTNFVSDVSNDNPNVLAIRALASKVLFALSVNFFNAVFGRISSKLQELASCPDENPDYSDIELIQHINVDVMRLTRLFTGRCLNLAVVKPRSLK